MKTKQLWNKLIKLNRIMGRKYKLLSIGVFVMIFFGALFEMIGVSIILPFIQMLTNPEELMEKSYIRSFMNLLHLSSVQSLTMMIGISIIVVYLIKNIYLCISSYFQIKFRTSMARHLRYQMMEAYLHRPYSFFVNTNTGDLVQGVTGDVLGVQNFVEYLLLVLSELMVVLLILGYIFSKDPLITLGVICIGILMFLMLALVWKRKMIQLGEKDRCSYNEMTRTSIEIAGGIRDIFVKKKHRFFMEQFDCAIEKNRKIQISAQFSYVLPKRLIEAVCICGIIAVILVRISTGVDYDVFIPQLAVFAVAAFRILPSMSRMIEGFNGMMFCFASVDSVYDNVKAAKDYLSKADKEQTTLQKEMRPSFTTCLKAEGVFFGYEGAEENVLENLNMIIHRGEAVGIIGKSGSGKSTLAAILLGLYQPNRGTVTMDGTSIYKMPDCWSDMVGFVPQDVFLRDATIRENVAFGEAQIDDTRVWNALERASLKAFVEELPNGLDTIVGENGIRFSGGQKQRVAIARALYCEPDILILDEATSSLDTETETAVMEAIDSLQGSITMIIIAHRLSTIQNCDRVYEIKDHQAYEVRGGKPFS